MPQVSSEYARILTECRPGSCGEPNAVRAHVVLGFHYEYSQTHAASFPSFSSGSAVITDI